jgi:glycosyltransferase involved in cell wall biosynthesis
MAMKLKRSPTTAIKLALRAVVRRLGFLTAGDFVEYIYQQMLQRPPDLAGRRYFIARLRRGRSLSRIAQEIAESPEAKQRQIRMDSFSSTHLSDGEFLLDLADLFLPDRCASAKEIEMWSRFLEEDPAKRSDMVRRRMSEYLARPRHPDPPLRDLDRRWIMGTDRFITPQAWSERVAQLMPADPARSAAGTRPVRDNDFVHTGQYLVSAITSLYKGGPYIERFLANITSQSIFDRCELIIIDANSPDDEARVIRDYQKVYPNIVYRRMDWRIGIYDAWNLAIENARGKYLTTTSVDDLRDVSSFEHQVDVLDRYHFVDVVYQDFFYTLDPTLSFSDIAALGFRSRLPTITAANLLSFNSPHNAPMWRRALHDDVGLFDTSFSSAADWEFWLRCLWKEKQFFKTRTAHVAYYDNPEGVSTRPDSRGMEEGSQILHRYTRRLIPEHLLMSRTRFTELVGGRAAPSRRLSYYDLVQRQLEFLADQRETRPEPRASSDGGVTRRGGASG